MPSIRLGKPAAPAVAPAAKAPEAPAAPANPQVRHGLPLSTTQLTDPKLLTPMERAQLASTGWIPGQPVPAKQLEGALAGIQAENDRPAPLPVDPNTPPVELKTVDISQLPPPQQAEYRHAMSAAAPAAPAGAQPVNWDRTQPAPPPLPPPPLTADVPGAKADLPAPAMGDNGTPHAKNCVHCGWDLSMTDIPEPDHATKMSFLAAFLGEKCWVKTYSLAGGALQLTLRTLTLQEMDACYAQAEADRKADRLHTVMDKLEAINRYICYLQIQRVQTPEGDYTFPEGYSDAGFNKHAKDFWELPEGTAPGSVELLREIEKHILSSVMSSSSMSRVIRVQAAEFGRLVDKLEVQVPNNPFWRKTEPPP